MWRGEPSNNLEEVVEAGGNVYPLLEFVDNPVDPGVCSYA